MFQKYFVGQAGTSILVQNFIQGVIPVILIATFSMILPYVSLIIVLFLVSVVSCVEDVCVLFTLALILLIIL